MDMILIYSGRFASFFMLVDNLNILDKNKYLNILLHNELYSMIIVIQLGILRNFTTLFI